MKSSIRVNQILFLKKCKGELLMYCFAVLLACFYSQTATARTSCLPGGVKVFSVREDIDLKGDTLDIPSGCSLFFRGGSICGGHIIFHDVRIKNRPSFLQCSYEGRIIIPQIDDRDFHSSDDIGTFRFLLSNAIALGIKCDFHRDYTFSMEGVSSEEGIVSINGMVSGAEINFNHHVIRNMATFVSGTIKPVIRLLNTKGITFRNCQFKDAEGNNTHLFPKSTGCTFVRCLGDCESINLVDCSQENGDCILRSGVYLHQETKPWQTPLKGLTNSVIKVSSKNTGYGIAIYIGDNLTLDVETDSPHRGIYCAGVSNSKIKYSGYNPKETKTHILLKDAVCKVSKPGENLVLDMRGCKNLVIQAHIKKLLQGEQILALQSYGTGLKENADFRFRKSKCHHDNIDFTAKVDVYPNIGYYTICHILSDSGADSEKDVIGCRVSKLNIHDIVNIGGKAKGYICNIKHGAEVNIKIHRCGLPDKKNAFNALNFQVVGNATGNISISRSYCGNILVREKQSGNFTFELSKDSELFGKQHYINDGSSKELVKIHTKYKKTDETF